MILRSKTFAAGSALVAVAHAAQPGAMAPVPSPMRNLTWGQINFIHTTDTHGWIGGHFQEYVLSGLLQAVANITGLNTQQTGATTSPSPSICASKPMMQEPMS